LLRRKVKGKRIKAGFLPQIGVRDRLRRNDGLYQNKLPACSVIYNLIFPYLFARAKLER
jgi:hypothetical protein